jgi:hypothetical protein
MDYKCNDGHITERYIDSSINTVKCDTCGNDSHKTLGLGTIILDGTDDGFPSNYERWANVREQRHRITMKKNREHGRDKLK